MSRHKTIEVVPSGVICDITGIQFPKLYRVTGNQWKLKEGVPEPESALIDSLDEIAEPGPPLGKPLYTLDPDADIKIANKQIEPISHLTEGIDYGWIFIRHHENEQSVMGYLDALFDTEQYEDLYPYSSRCVRTDLGIFTMLHRLPTPGTPSLALVYCTKYVDFRFNSGLEEWTYVLDCLGKPMDIDDLMPVEVYDSFGDITDRLNKLFKR